MSARARQNEDDRLPAWLNAVLPEIRTADGFFVVTADQRIVHWSPSAQHILGHAPNDVLGCYCHDVIAGHDVFNARFCHLDCPVVKNARRGRPTDNYDLLVHDQEGTARWINVTVVVLPGPRRREPVILHLFRDVTKQRHLEERARKVLDTLKRVVSDEEAGGEEVPALVGQPPPRARLTRRELEVLRLMTHGLSARRIGEILCISPVTARNHMTAIQTKLEARNRVQAILYAAQLRLV